MILAIFVISTLMRGPSHSVRASTLLLKAGAAPIATGLVSMLAGENLTQIEAAAGVAGSTVRKENKRLRKVIGLQ